MRLHDSCPKCNSGTIRCRATKLIDDRRYRVRSLYCDNVLCDATGHEVEEIDDRGRKKFADKLLILECPHCGRNIQT